jgi:hypothetical protein
MKFWAWSALSLLALAATLSLASANVPPPRLPPANLRAGASEVKLVVVIDAKVKQPRLEVPRNLLVAPRLGPARPGRIGAIDSTPNVTAGLALALAFTSGGLWLSKRGRSVAIALAAVALFSLGGAVSADLVKPKGPRELPAVVLPAEVKMSGKLTLQIVDRGDAVRLVVNSSMLPGPKRAPALRPED